MTFITKLTAGTVVDRAGLNKLKTEEMATTLAELYKDPAVTVLIVDNVQQFFSVKNLMAALDDNSPALPMLLEQKGITLTDEDIDTVRQFSEVKQHILDILEANKPPLPPYPFADVPDGWTVATHVTFGKNFIRRTRGDADHRATPNTVRRLWNFAAARWAAGRKVSDVMDYQSYNGYTKCAEVYPNYVQIGCQRYERYELEQLAVHMNWDFPEVPVAD